MKFLDFMEKRLDPFIKLSLTDLAKTLAKNPDLSFDFSFHSTYRPLSESVTVSHYWSRLLDDRKKDGMKSDVYLRAYGNRRYTHYQAVHAFWEKADQSLYPSFSKQLFSLLEDSRLERVIIHQRPGMARAFESRKALFQKRFRERYTYHKERKNELDLLFCAIYLQIFERPLALPPILSNLKVGIRELVQRLSQAESTEDCASITLNFLTTLPSEWHDMTESYFMMDPTDLENDSVVPFPGEKNALVRDRELDLDEEPDSDSNQEKLPTWHADQDQEGDSFLQFDLDEGAGTDLMGEGERQAESGDQAFASLEGQTQKSNGNQFDELPDANSPTPPGMIPSRRSTHAKEINRLADTHFVKSERPSPEDLVTYKDMVSQTLSAQKALKRSIQKLIDQKKQAPRSDLHIGRFGKKLTRIVTEGQNPRLFYKKQAESRELDVVFQLLVDCSASMHDKMAETKVGITLFHESLRALGIAHSITGFWEDALHADDTKQPNYFLEVLPYEASLLPDQGPKLLQLQPEEDNRDGLAIRESTKKLIRRTETNKILMVFTDGEPSAFNYQEDGIVDTHEAVLEARKLGIEVIGVLLSDSYTQESEKETLKNIYGKSSLVIPTAEEIPEVLTPLLRKLLARMIH